MVLEQQNEHGSAWAAINSLASKIGCTHETLRRWVQQSETDRGIRPGLSNDDAVRMKSLERENRELKRDNEILRKASAFFARGNSTLIGLRPAIDGTHVWHRQSTVRGRTTSQSRVSVRLGCSSTARPSEFVRAPGLSMAHDRCG